MQINDQILHFLPLIVGAISATVMIFARILTNHVIKEYQYKLARETFEKIKLSDDEAEKERLFQERELGVVSNPPSGTIPVVYSIIYLIALFGLIISFFWAFVSIAWWAGVVVLFFYLFTGLFPTLMRLQRK